MMLPTALYLALLFASAFRAFDAVPKALQPPEGSKLVLQAHGKGDQVYACQTRDAKTAWVLKRPQAQLTSPNGEVLGRHGEGPAWQAKDGSRITAAPLANEPSPDSGAIPWLLLKVKSHEGSGTFSSVEYVQRLNTRGGKPPLTGCDAAQESVELAVPYEADYLFYGPR